MQDTKNFIFIDEIMNFKTALILLDENYKILQYKILDKNNDTKLNNIYCGIIEKIDYSIESIFVKISDNTFGFLPFRQLSSYYYDKKNQKFKKKISKGDKILVQVIRDSIESKSVKLTNNIVFSSLFCVFLPFGEGEHGVSSNIKADQRLFIKSFLNSLDKNGDLIIRTSATESSIEEIEQDFISLKELFNFVFKKFKQSKSFQLLFENDDLIYVLRSYSKFLIEEVFVRTKKTYDLLFCYKQQKLIKFPSITIKNNFDFLKNIEDQLDLLYKTELFLPSNASIIIEKTEAMVTIDVNSKRCFKGKNMEETSLNINLESANLIVDQIILRNLGGIISVDLIDMKKEEHLNLVYEKFKQAFKRDKASVKLLPINALCVLQISRERKGLSLLDLDYQRCSNCKNGLVLSKNFLTSDFVKKISKYDFFCYLEIHINLDLFNNIFKKHHNFINQYKNLKWQILEIESFKIYDF